MRQYKSRPKNQKPVSIDRPNLLDQALLNYEAQDVCYYEMDEGGLEILNEEMRVDIEELRSWLRDLSACLHKNETENISYLMTGISCQADNLYKKYIAGPNRS